MPISAGDLAVMNKGRVCGTVLRCKEKKLPMVQMCCNPQARKKILNCCWQYNVIIELAVAMFLSFLR